MLPTHRPVRAEWQLGIAGRALAFVAVGGFLPSLVIGGRTATVPALAAALLGLAALIGRRNVGRLELGVEPVLRATAGSRATLRTVVRAAGRRGRVRDLTVRHQTPGERGPGTPRGYVDELRRGAVRELACAHRVGARGAHTVHRATVETSYPLGLIERRLHFALPVEHLVRPPYGELRGSLLEELRVVALGVEPGRRRGHDELDGLRPWREGESLRHVHWRASARTGRRVAREMTGDERPPLLLCLSPLLVGRRSVRRSRALEEAVALVATLVREARARGLAVRLCVLGPRPTTLELDRGRMRVEAALDLLARVEAGSAESVPELEPPRVRRGGAAWLVSPGPVHAPRFDLVLDVDRRDLDLVFESPFGPEERVVLG